MKVMVPVDPEKVLISSSISDENPADWLASANYAKGATVTHAQGVYVALVEHSAKYPDREPEVWQYMHPATPELWVSSKTYAAGETVYHKRQRYASLKDANTGYIPETAREWWSAMGPINSWAAFDKTINTKATALGEICFELDFSRANTVALFGLEGSTAHMTLRNGTGDVVEEKVITMSSFDATSWLEYFLDPKTPREDVIQTTFPVMAYSRMTIVIKAVPGGIARVGHVAVGRCKTIGKTQYGVENGITDYSRKSTDTFGNTYLSVGAWSKTVRMDLHIWNRDYDDIYRTLANLRATPTVFVGDNEDAGLDALTVWGYVRDFRMVIDDVTHSQCSLEVQGLI